MFTAETRRDNEADREVEPRHGSRRNIEEK